MQSTIVFVLLFSLRTISLGADVTVYEKYYYDYSEPEKLGPVALSQFPWKFGYSWHNEFFLMHIFINNKSPSMTAIKVTYQLDDRTVEVEKSTYKYGRRKGEEYYYVEVSDLIKFTEIKITFMLYTSKVLCSSLLVAKGKEVSTITNELPKNEYPHYDIFTKHGHVLEVDLTSINKCDGPPLVTISKTITTTENDGTDGETINPINTFTFNSSTNLEITTNKNSAIDTSPPLVTKTKIRTTTENDGTDGETINHINTFTFNSSTNLEITTNKNSAIDTKNAERRSSENIVLIYVIPSVIGMCVLILVIGLISVKKYCHRNSDPVETTELNTYSTTNEVVYADLGLVHGDSQPPRCDEESPYVQIIGVLNPVNGNVNNI